MILFRTTKANIVVSLGRGQCLLFTDNWNTNKVYRQTQNVNAIQKCAICTLLCSVKVLCLTVHPVCISATVNRIGRIHIKFSRIVSLNDLVGDLMWLRLISVDILFEWVWNLVVSHWGRNVGWELLRIGCWGENLGVRGTK